MAELITSAVYHRQLDRIELTRRREAQGLTQLQFADRCGWAQQYQSKLEDPAIVKDVHIDVLDRIKKVLKIK